MISSLRRAAPNVLLIATTAMGCQEVTPESPPGALSLDVTVDVESDPGRGTADAEISDRGKTLARTDGHGRASLRVEGTEGDVLFLSVRCPAGFESPSQPVAVALRRPSRGSAAPRFDARCAPLSRTTVVGVRAERGAHLPILYLGREIGRTDDSGVASIVLDVKPGDAVSIVLDTSGVSPHAKLIPESPTLTFVARDRDDYVVLDQRFETERTAPRRATPVARPAGPTRI